MKERSRFVRGARAFSPLPLACCRRPSITLVRMERYRTPKGWRPKLSGGMPDRASRMLALPFFAAMITCFAYPASAVTLQEVLRSTLDNDPAILEAKAGLEQAAGQRLVFRSIVWPDFDVLVPAGVQYGHRAGENGIKGFAVGRGNLEQTLFNMAVPPSLRRGDIEVLIAQQQIGRASCRESR